MSHRNSMRYLSRELLLLLGAVVAGPAQVAAQTPSRDSASSSSIVIPTPEKVTAGAEVITAQEIATHLRVLATDSFRDRDTPSAGLEAAGRYLARQFEALGLTPLSTSRTLFQRYFLPPQLDFDRSRLVFTTGDRQAVANFTATAWVEGRLVVAPKVAAPAPAVLVAGRQSVATVTQLDVRSKVVFYVPHLGIDPLLEQQIVYQLRGASRGVVVAAGPDSLAFAAQVREGMRDPGVRVGASWIAHVRPEGVAGLGEMLAAGGVDLARARSDTTPMVRDLTALQVVFESKFTRAPNDTTTAANVVGVLEGADPKFKREHLIFVAHLDNGRGQQNQTNRIGQADSAAAGVHDNAVGVAGLLALAKAFSQPGARPARSVAFLATSGGAKDFWGSRAFTANMDDADLMNPILNGGVVTVDALTSDELMTALNLDGIARPANTTADSAVVINGLDDVKLPTPAPWLAATHPELRLSVTDGGTVAEPTSDQFVFVQRGVPSLWFHGIHGASPERSTNPAAIDVEWAARVIRLAYYVGQDVANAKQRPQSTPEGRQHQLDAIEP